MRYAHCKGDLHLIKRLSSYFYKVDIDQEPELASVFGIQSIPTFLFVPMKGNPSLEMGMMEKGEIETRMKNILHLN